MNFLPAKNILIKGYPNPFNNSISLEVTVPETDRYAITVYNINGQKINSLFAGSLTAGNHKFNWQVTRDISSGLYFLAVQSVRHNQKYKMIYIK
jgi:hypothetical protein